MWQNLCREAVKQSGKKKRKSKCSRSKKQKVLALDPICCYCQKAKSVTVDHVIPRSKGGSNDLSNLVGCCYPCNQKKADMPPQEAGMILHLPDRMS